MANGKILLVEDESIEALDIKSTLESFGYEVPAVVSTGEEAVKKALEIMPDLILMDIILKGEIDGIDAASQIKSHNIPVIFLTAHSEDTTIKRAKFAEPYGYLLKPFDVIELKYAIELAIYKNKMENELKKSEKQFRDLYNSMSEGLAVHRLIYDNDHQPVNYEILNINSVFEKILDIKKEDVVGKNATEAYNTEEPPYLDVYANVVRSRTPTKFETYFPPMDKFFSISVFSPSPGLFATVFEDITEEKRTKNALEKSEEKYRNLFETMALGVVYQDASGEIISANPAAEEILGLTLDEMMGRTSTDPRWRGIKEDGSDMPGNEHPSMLALKTGKKVNNAVMGVFDPKRGENRWIKINAIPQFKNGEIKPYQVFTTFEDITDSKKAENREKLLSEQRQIALDAANMGWWHYDPITQISTYDEGYKKIFGVSGSKRPNEEILKLLHPDDIPSVWEKVEAALDPVNTRPYAAEYRIFRGNDIRWIQAYGMGKFEGQGKEKHATGLVGTVQDITERKQMEDELQLSQEKYRNALDNMMEGCQIINHDWEYIYVNDSAARHGNVKKEELLGHTMMEKYPGIEDTEMFARLKRAMEERLSCHLDNYFIYPDGTGRWFELSIFPVPEGIFILSYDVTERKKIENELKNSNEWLSFVQKAAKTGFWDWDMKTEKLIWSPEFYELFGLKPDSEPSFDTWLEILHPDDRENAMEMIKKAIDNKIFLENEYRLIRPDGVELWIRALGSTYYDDYGEPTRMSGICFDITDNKKREENRRELEERYHSLFDRMLNGLAYCKMIYKDGNPIDFVYIDVNKSFESLTGLTDVIGKKVSEVIPNIRESDPELLEIYGRVARSGQPETFEMYVNSLKMWFSVSVYSSRKEYFVAVFDVITDRKNAEIMLQKRREDLEKAVEELTRSNKDLEQFAYISSHDLQEPLRSVSGFLQLLVRRYGEQLDPKAQEYIDISVGGVKRMQVMIEDLLDFSRVTTRGKEFRLIKTNEIVENVILDLKSSIDKNSAVISCEQLPDILADGSQIYQVFQNLINNAIKFRSEKSPVIKISAEENDSEWIFAVEDNGIGIAPKFQNEIFEVFKRLHPRRKYSGTGIGLAIVRRVVERHGGRVWVDSNVDEGSTFYFTISKKNLHTTAKKQV